MIGVMELAVLFMLAVGLATFIVWLVALVDILRSEFTGNNKIIWLLVVIFVPLILRRYLKIIKI